MRAVNLYYLSGISNERLFSDYENILSGRNSVTRIRRADQTALRSLLKALKKRGLTELSLYDGFFERFFKKAFAFSKQKQLPERRH